MALRSSNRVPLEIWECILEDVIAFNENIALQATCSPSTYLAFKGSCREGPERFPRPSYLESEKERRNLRQVCHSWKRFADHPNRQNRWVGIIDLVNQSKPYSTWENPLRIDMFTPLDNGRPPKLSPEARQMLPQIAEEAIRTWCSRGRGEGAFMNVIRLDLTSATYSPLNNFRCPDVFEPLCRASSRLCRLLSLSLSIHSSDPTIYQSISLNFPQLTHLKLVMQFTLYEPAGDIPKTILSLRNLEILSLNLPAESFDLSHWTFPQIHTLHIVRYRRWWDANIYPFLLRHVAKLETLDLDYWILRTKEHFRLPDEFWDQLAHLRLLRICLYSTEFVKFPHQSHPLEWLVDSGEMMSRERFLVSLTRWSDMREEGFRPLQILLHGYYAKAVSRGIENRAVNDLLHRLKTNGTRLVVL